VFSRLAKVPVRWLGWLWPGWRSRLERACRPLSGIPPVQPQDQLGHGESPRDHGRDTTARHTDPGLAPITPLQQDRQGQAGVPHAKARGAGCAGAVTRDLRSVFSDRIAWRAVSGGCWVAQAGAAFCKHLLDFWAGSWHAPTLVGLFCALVDTTLLMLRRRRTKRGLGELRARS
jgi:hypothetical protein